MAYGRLDVYWPDRPAESFQLDQPSIAIGRSSGNDIMLDATSVSRYHISISQENGQVIVRDLESVNGTYLDGKKMNANQPYVLRGGEEIQIGDLMLIFQPLQTDIPTVPTSAEELTTQQITIEGLPFRLEVEPIIMPVAPGAHTQNAVTIYNLGKENERYTVEVEGIPREWVRVDRPELEIRPNDNAIVTLNVKPMRRFDSTPGNYTLKITVRMKNAPERMIDAQLPLKVLPYSGFGMALANYEVELPNPFDLYVQNQGSAPLTIAFFGRTAGDLLMFDIQPPTLTLAPGERQRVRGNIRPRGRAIFGTTQRIPFDVLVQSKDKSNFLATVPGLAVIKPVVRGFGGMALLGVLALALIFLVIQLTTPRAAEIVAFEVNPPLSRAILPKTSA